MKYLLNILLIIVSVLLSACESTGWQWQGAPDAFTPGVSADTKVRTWDGDGKPHVRKEANEPAFLYDAEADRAQK